jgi:SAM-dependent methyltransferase
MDATVTTNDRIYWNGFYRTDEAEVLLAPSQFAAFALGETADADVVFDIGCGTGRDSLFLAAFGKKVVGVDSSVSATTLCQKAAESRRLNATFITADVLDADLAKRLNILRAGCTACVYARFFLHAIDEFREDAFLTLAKSLAGGGYLAVEFRTNQDVGGAKVTPDHYRRFINPEQFEQKTLSLGFEKLYGTVGKGYAKYKQDDAHVARYIFKGLDAC